jgi:hypothetical protein
VLVEHCLSGEPVVGSGVGIDEIEVRIREGHVGPEREPVSSWWAQVLGEGTHCLPGPHGEDDRHSIRWLLVW